MTFNYVYKYIIIGDIGVGKSCLLLRFTNNEYKNTHNPTVGLEFISQVVNINDSLVKLQIWDTAGQEEFKSMTRAYYRSAAGILLVYDVTRRSTFENVKHWLMEAKNYGHDNMTYL